MRGTGPAAHQELREKTCRCISIYINDFEVISYSLITLFPIGYRSMVSLCEAGRLVINIKIASFSSIEMCFKAFNRLFVISQFLSEKKVSRDIRRAALI
jgi:hypothetical protein